ncbi:baseplate J/gp47 family protein [Pelosinus sp. IPA-1]|uniref:baseplate assembly protein n=1 Tax=Pelosinus sp. IPA-1 TaxID=3029569 RepID=UPI002436163D|nr:baseplate J/gp47 family protein [Pelosinus sp. IPA-1]GMB00445.1 hypothetical protein PIPA1_32440 [Pelosinus sp. IPA-1]
MLNNLPDISFTTKDPAQIEAEMLAAYQAQTGTTLATADPRKKLLQAQVPIIVGQRAAIDYSAKMNLLAYAKGDFLDHIGAELDCSRLLSSPALMTERFTLSAVQTSPYLIPKGIRVTVGDNVFFSTVADTLVPAGALTADITVQCMTSGVAGNNYALGTVATLVDPLPYVASVTNTTVSSGGVDVEEDDAYRERIHEAPEKFSVAGPEGAYSYWAKTASSTIIDVAVTSPSPGVVSLYPLVSGGNLPTPDLLNAVAAICSDRKVRPLTDNVQVAAPTGVNYNIDVTYWIAQKDATIVSTLQSAIQQAAQNYIAWQRSKLGRSIDPSQLIFLMKQAGAERVAVSAPVYQALTLAQVAQEQTVSIKYGGTE